MPASDDRGAALIGQPLEEVDTPALLVDLDAMERNLDRMQAMANAVGIALRPHAKTHKSPVVARAQIDRGAKGICCAKLGEAEVMVAAGIPDILVTTPVIGPAKLRRLVAAQRLATETGVRLSIVVDDEAHIEAIETAMRAADLTQSLVVEVDVGSGRTGVEPGPRAGELAVRIARSNALSFRGLQGYNGKIVLKPDPAERRAGAAETIELLRRSADGVRAHGLDIEILTGGGTGSSLSHFALGGIDEVQAGTYVFMDTAYAGITWDETGAAPPFENALEVLATVVSRPKPEMATIDMGLKSASVDMGLPSVVGIASASFRFGGEEHGIVTVEDPAERPAIGDQVRIRPSHGDTTINLYDRYVCHRRGVVEAVWAIEGRGRSQ